MDANRRRKTVIAGAFAIERKSVSNPYPISADESHRATQVDMVTTSMREPSFHSAQTVAEGFSRALSQHLQHSQKQRRARAHTREGRGEGLDPQDPLEERAGAKPRSSWPCRRPPGERS